MERATGLGRRTRQEGEKGNQIQKRVRDDEPVIVNKRVVDVIEEMWVLRREVA